MARRAALAVLVLCLLAPAAAQASRTLYSNRIQQSVVWSFPITVSDGSLGSGTSTATTGSNSVAETLSTDGRYLFVLNLGSDTVTVYTVDSATGVPTLKSTSPGITGMASAIGIAASPDGSHVYVVGNSGQHNPGSTTQTSVQALKLDPVAGTLSLDGPVVPAGSSRSYRNPDSFLAIAVSPDGRHLFLDSSNNDQISQVAINADGTLDGSAIVNVATATGGPGGPLGLAVNPNGTALYVVDGGDPGVDGTSVSAYPLTSGAFTSATPVAVTVGSGGLNPVDGAVSPDGKYLYVTNGGDGTAPTQNIATLSLNADGTNASTTATTVADTDGVAPQSIVVSPDGRHVYAGNVENSMGAFPGNVVVYSSSNGVLTRASVGAATAAPFFRSLAISPNQGPTASFTAPSSPEAATAAGFDASGSSDPDGTVARYDWDFGDGTTAMDAGPTPSHAYGHMGGYTATVTVTDNEGCSTSLVYTGTIALCNGTSAATTTRSVTVGKASPGLVTHASAGVTLGGQVTDTATISGGSAPSGTITYKLYGPDDASCSGTPVTSTKTASGDNDYTSNPVTPSAPGTYRWVVSYAGDTDNNGAGPGACNDANESVTVTNAPPTARTDTASDVSTTTATLHGSVNPNGVATTYRFEYGATTAYGSSVPSPDGSAGSDFADHAESQPLTGLAPSTTYHFRLVATSARGTATGADQLFTTSAASGGGVAPTVVTGPVDGVTRTSAVLHGSVDRHGLATTYHFDYGRTVAYGASTVAQDAGSGTAGSDVSAALTGLKPGLSYHVRLVATSAAGTTSGGDVTFETAARLPGGFRFPAHVVERNGGLRLTFKLPGAGSGEVLAMHVLSGAAAAALQPWPHHFVYGRARFDAAAAGPLVVHLEPTAEGRRLLDRQRHRHGVLHVLLKVAFTPVGGQTITKVRNVLIRHGRPGA